MGQNVAIQQTCVCIFSREKKVPRTVSWCLGAGVPSPSCFALRGIHNINLYQMSPSLIGQKLYFFLIELPCTLYFLQFIKQRKHTNDTFFARFARILLKIHNIRLFHLVFGAFWADFIISTLITSSLNCKMCPHPLLSTSDWPPCIHTTNPNPWCHLPQL